MSGRKKDGATTPSPRKRGATSRATEAVSADSAPSTPCLLRRATVEVRWRDLDAFSHVNNSSFLTYIEEARLQWFQSLPGPWLSDDSAPVLAATHVNYRRPIEWPEQLMVELYAERVGNTSLTVAHRIVAAHEPGTLYSDGYSVLVWINRHDGKPAPMPEAVRGACVANLDLDL